MNDSHFLSPACRSGRRARGVFAPAAAGLVALGAALLAAFPSPAPAQTAADSIENREIFEPLSLPDPNGYRTADGRPGPDYWQQRVDYEIDVQLQPEENRVSGSETITYTNNSPLSLDRLWVQLDQNRFDPTSEGARISDPGARFRGAFEGGGYDISGVTVRRNGESREPEYLIDGTVMRVDLAEPLPGGGGTLKLSLDFTFTVPEHGADRMGRMEVEQGTVYQLAQWYPRVFTYDDAGGWNVLPYLGQGEFYLEYGSFDVEVTVPREFVVVGTGRLQNPDRVLTLVQRQRLARARTSAEPVHLIQPGEVGEPSTRPEGEGPLTWHFRADSVRDFAWAASQAFVWDAAGWNDVLLMSAYPKEGLGGRAGGRPGPMGAGWERSTSFLRHSVAFYSEKWGVKYPYPVAVNVAGPVRGMEYPMVLFCSVEARGPGLFGVTDHELGHAWFPMMVGSDERRYFWMDEGLNSFMNHYSMQDFFGDLLSGRGRLDPDTIASTMTAREWQPIMTRSDRIREAKLGFTAYRKPAFGLWLLREFVVGAERFDPAFRAYMERWAYRHPQPADFFRTIEDVAGMELDWFWRGWFYSTDVLDQEVRAVVVHGDTARVHLENRKGLVMPAQLRLSFADGSQETRRIPVEAWFSRDRFVEVVRGKKLTEVVLDPNRLLPDVDRSNNSWRVKAKKK